MIYIYNSTKYGVDKEDQIISIYETKRKIYECRKAIFFVLLMFVFVMRNTFLFAERQ